MDTFLVSLLLSFIASVVLTPVMIRVARHAGTFDDAGVSHRKVHAGNIPRLGGVAIVAAFYTPIVGLSFYSTRVGDSLLNDSDLALGLLGGGLMIALLGLYDDLKGASPRLKLLVQLGVAIILCNLGFVIDRVDLPFLKMMHLGLLAWPVTILWIVGVTNAVNLIDGLDGLAAGMALFGLLPIVVLAIAKGNVLLALLCCCLAGAVLGFLVFNFHPAKIFMGDTGSMFLGFVLAVVTVETSHKGRVAVAMLTPVLALGLPILDTLLALARRAWFGQSLFAGDRQHIHHRLLASGLSHRNTVLVMYGFSAIFAILALGVGFNRDWTDQLLFFLSLVTAAILLRQIGVLAFPAQLGVEVSVAGAIRERNRMVRKILKSHEAHIVGEVSLEALVSRVSHLAMSTGAMKAEFVLPGQPARQWTWTYEDATELGQQETFNIPHPEGGMLGSLHLWWHADDAHHEAVLSTVEAATIELGTALVPLTATTPAAESKAG